MAAAAYWSCAGPAPAEMGNLLRWHVRRRPADLTHHRQPAQRRGIIGAGQAEVGQFALVARSHQQVRRFHVAMDKSLCRGRTAAHQHLAGQADGAADRQRTVLLDHCRRIGAIDVLHDEVQKAGSLAAAVEN